MSTIFRKPADADRNIQATIYVGNLDPKVTELLLYELLLQFAPVKSLHFPKDRVSKTHQGYGFAEFLSEEEAEYIIEIINGVRLFGKPLRVKRADSNQSGGANGSNSAKMVQVNKALDVGAKLFIKNLHLLIDEIFLKDTFSQFGTLIRDPEIVRDADGVSKGYGFLVFSDFEESDKALELMNGKLLMNQRVEINYAFKEGKKVRHGDQAERQLAASAKVNKLIK